MALGAITALLVVTLGVFAALAAMRACVPACADDDDDYGRGEPRSAEARRPPFVVGD